MTKTLVVALCYFILIFTKTKAERSAGCRELRSLMTRQAQILGTGGVKVFIPLCKQNGDFEEIQCDNFAGRCWCVDKQGLEKPGTRASNRNLVNCRAPKKCASMLCRMLCPYNFELDDDGCPLCQCRDLCKGIKCPGHQECQVEEIPCSESLCPPLPTCKRARSLDTLCPTGRPLSSTGNRPFLCGMEPNKPQCPPDFICDVESGNEYGICCPLKDKPGKCPSDIRMAQCGTKCSIDIECDGDKKCCEVEGCNKICLIPQNTSLCFQQAETAALLARPGNFKAHVPQCTKDGKFEPKQCLDNLCWCVDSKGLQIAGSFGMKETVICKSEEEKALPKPGTCPDNFDCSGKPCMSDFQCEGKQRCCESSECGFRCTLPKQTKLPTTCEHLRSVGEKLLSHNQSLALPIPQCLPDGTFKPVQCDNQDKCWCVNEFGVKIGDASSKYEWSCREGRAQSCDGHICRLGCTYGFEMDERGCEICECRDPCQDANCPPNQICQMVQVDCDHDWCPNIPQCTALPENVCPHGNPLLNDVKKTPVICNTDFVELKESSCPKTHKCIEFQPLYGVCCPSIRPVVVIEKPTTAVKIGSCPSVQPWEVGACINQCETDSDCHGYQKCCLNGCDKYVCRDPEGFLGKLGQCPYNLSSEEVTCDFQCKSDYQCDAGAKCCSNGCGMQCMDPLKMTACQHQRIASEMSIKQLGLNHEEVYMPSCQSDGRFEEVQCDPVKKHCWCIDDKGIRIPGTVSVSKLEINCTHSRNCPAIECSLNCPNGLQESEEGCPICVCKDPCEVVKCRNPSEECRSVNVKCITEPCPPLALCLPKLQNPCPVGKPLQKLSGNLFTCGLSGNKCPSSHRCHLSPLNEYSVCCPKTRTDCFVESSYGTCELSIGRWYFNQETNLCEKFNYSGCGGNLNNFESKEHCEATCPVITSCQTVRDQALAAEGQADKVLFVPKCNRITGDWESIQCLESLGLCWCVNNKGQKIPGTAVRGTPICHKRKGRRLDDDPVCPFGEPVFKCPNDLCKNKMCFSHPKASCRINPCGGCHVEFYGENNHRVNCNQGLTACHSEVQEILNSPAWVRQGMPYKDVAHLLPKEYRMASTQFSEIINQESEPQRTTVPDKPSSISHVTLDIGLGGSKITFHTADEKHQPQIQKKSGTEAHSGLRTALKGGSCPSVEMHSMFKGLISGCGKGCSVDADCIGIEKCCLTGCGLTCEKPLSYSKTVAPAHSITNSLNVMPPKCSSEGGYSVVQKQGELSWCVNKFGNPIHSTLTRGEINCNIDGTIKERNEYSPVCPHSKRAPKVCKNECINAYCHQHPDAICKADPCDDCSVSFYDHKGEKVNCIDKCLQPLERGNCAESLSRYHFNNVARRCEMFLYSGCGKNDNHFINIHDCQQTCNKPVPVCEQPLDSGTCRAFMPRWFYNKFTHRCERFHFGGCGGNNNNFETRELCEARCPDLVLCPWSSAGVTINSCSRYKSCVNKKCPGNPKAICTVDPCSCEAYFVDQFGKFVACDYSSRGPLELITSPMTEETRCQSVRRRHLSTGAAYIAQCTKDGKFVSKQCALTPRGTTECWCVDELGKQLENSASFLQEHGSCEQVKIDHVEVTLAFKHNSSQYTEGRKSLIKSAVRRYLQNISANIGDVQLRVLPNNTVIVFKLTGDNKDHVAYQLERMVKNGGMALHSQSAVLPVDVRSSHFHHMNELAPKDFTETRRTDSMQPAEGGSAVMALVIVAVVGIILVLLVLATLVHKRKRMGFAPRMESKFQKSRETIRQLLFGKCAFKNQEKDRKESSSVTTCKMRPNIIENSEGSSARTITAASQHTEFNEVRDVL